MSTPVAQLNPTLDRLEDQIAWYDRKSESTQRFYKFLKVLTLLSAALVPVLSVIEKGRVYAAVLGIVIVVAQGLEQMNQLHSNWMTYRSTCESLKHEKYLYLAQAGPYAGADRPVAVLAERTEALISREHARWIASREDANKARTASKPPTG